MQVTEQPILGLDSIFPDRLYVLHHSASGKYGCYCHDGVHGVACFSNQDNALRFATEIDLSGMSMLEMSFDEAREVAQGRPMPIIALILLDDMNSPQIHFVR